MEDALLVQGALLKVWGKSAFVPLNKPHATHRASSADCHRPPRAIVLAEVMSSPHPLTSLCSPHFVTMFEKCLRKQTVSLHQMGVNCFRLPIHVFNIPSFIIMFGQNTPMEQPLLIITHRAPGLPPCTLINRAKALHKQPLRCVSLCGSIWSLQSLSEKLET